MSATKVKESCRPGFSPGPNFPRREEMQNWIPVQLRNPAGATVVILSAPK